MINVLFGITQPVIQLLKKNFTRVDEQWEADDLTSEERKKFRLYTSRHWKPDNSGAVIREVVSSYISPETVSDTDKDLADVNLAIAKFTGQITVLGAWNQDGTQYGMQLHKAVYDLTDGSILVPESVTGTPVYSINEAIVLKYMPNGVLEEVNNLYGWKDRRWS